MVQDLISIVTVRSFARFAPSPVKLNFPEFLNNIAVVDWTNETTFDVIQQRHEVLIKEMAREEKEFAEAQAHEEQLQALENEMELVGASSMMAEDQQGIEVL